MSERVIVTHGLTKYYGKNLGVTGLDFEVHQGEVFGYLGPNGAGKTTTLRLLTGLLMPTSGNADVLGFDLRKESLAIRDRIGYIPGDVRLFEDLTGRETLRLLDSLRPDRPPVLRDDLVQRFELDLSRKVGEYSSGNKQKLAIVQAFMHDPELLVLDEPTSTLDPLMRHRFYELCREFRERGRTIFISSHILPEMEQICDWVGIIRTGKLVTVESVAELSRKKLRHADFTLLEEPEAALLDFESATLHRVDGLKFEADIKGDMDTFIKELSRLHLSDLQISHASLEEIFMEFYREEDNDHL
ncbi:MAG: ABC transporter ATP-binding protein [Actinobacteria bacterium]|nr:ABC transporter ATP-binding protein [Actinomycetota bacterium]